MVFDFFKKLAPGSIERDLLKRHAGPFVFCFFTIMFLLLMQFLIQFMDHLIGKGIPLTVILELIMVNLAYMVVLAVPMTILAASLMAYGKFSEQNEYTAVRAAGVHPFRILRPSLLTALIFTVFLGWFSNEVLPEANYKARALFLDIRMKKPGFDLQENIFYEGISGYTFLVREMPADTDSLYEVTLFQNPEQGRDRAVIKARKGLLESDERHMSLTLHLFDGTIMRYLQRGRSSASIIHEETAFESYRITFDLSDLTFSRTNPDDRRRDGRSMRAQAMLAVVDSLRSDISREIAHFKHSLHQSHITLLREDEVSPPTGEADRDSEYLTHREDYTETIEASVTRRARESEFPAEDVPYQALAMLETLQDQREVALRASTQMRNTQVATDNLLNNLRWREERIARFMVEVHKKVSIPFGCILFAMIGAPLGLLVRKGHMGIHAIISTVLFTYYWISIIQGEKLADRMFVSPFMGMWFGNMTIAVAGFMLMYLVIVRR
jgi:lipopolysaccharide export system permease protein